jgi:hypothetical protein
MYLLTEVLVTYSFPTRQYMPKINSGSAVSEGLRKSPLVTIITERTNGQQRVEPKGGL